MRAPGRYWWTRLLLLPLLGGVAAGMLWLLGPNLLDDPDMRMGILIIGMSLLACCLLAIYSAFDTHRRYRLRVAALRAATHGGYGEPPDEIEHVIGLPVLAVEPLTILWQFTRRGRWLTGAAFGQFAFDTCKLSQPVVALLRDRGITISGPLAQTADDHNLLFSLFIPFGSLIVVTVIAQALLARPFGVLATEEGIEMRRILGRSRRVRWEDAILFEDARTNAHYILYSRNSYVTWQWERNPKVVTPLGISDDEASKRAHTLLLLTQHRTRLAPQSIVKPLFAFDTAKARSS